MCDNLALGPSQAQLLKKLVETARKTRDGEGHIFRLYWSLQEGHILVDWSPGKEAHVSYEDVADLARKGLLRLVDEVSFMVAARGFQQYEETMQDAPIPPIEGSRKKPRQ